MCHSSDFVPIWQQIHILIVNQFVNQTPRRWRRSHSCCNYERSKRGGLWAKWHHSHRFTISHKRFLKHSTISPSRLCLLVSEYWLQRPQNFQGCCSVPYASASFPKTTQIWTKNYPNMNTRLYLYSYPSYNVKHKWALTLRHTTHCVLPAFWSQFGEKWPRVHKLLAILWMYRQIHIFVNIQGLINICTFRAFKSSCMLASSAIEHISIYPRAAAFSSRPYPKNE